MVKIVDDTLHITIYREFCEPLKKMWLALQDDVKVEAFQTYEWLFHWQSVVGSMSDNISPCLIVVHDNCRSLAAIFPFSLRRVGIFRVIEFMGGAQSDYNAILLRREYRNHNAFKDIWKLVLRNLPSHDIKLFLRMPLVLDDLPNPMVSILPVSYQTSSYSATLASSWELFSNRLPSKMLKENARFSRRLSEIGRLKFKIATSIEDYNNLCEDLFRQKQMRYNETGARNILLNLSVKNFYKNAFFAKSNRIQFQLSSLMLDDKTMATHWGVIYGDTFYYLLPAFESGDLDKYSPGRLLLQNLIEWAIGAGIKKFDFTTGSESYKRIWCDSTVKLYKAILPNTFLGIIFKIIFEFAFWAMKFRYIHKLAVVLFHKLKKYE